MQKLLKTTVFAQETRGRWIEGGGRYHIYIYMYYIRYIDIDIDIDTCRRPARLQKRIFDHSSGIQVCDYFTKWRPGDTWT